MNEVDEAEYQSNQPNIVGKKTGRLAQNVRDPVIKTVNINGNSYWANRGVEQMNEHAGSPKR